MSGKAELLASKFNYFALSINQCIFRNYNCYHLKSSKNVLQMSRLVQCQGLWCHPQRFFTCCLVCQVSEGQSVFRRKFLVIKRWVMVTWIKNPAQLLHCAIFICIKIQKAVWPIALRFMMDLRIVKFLRVCSFSIYVLLKLPQTQSPFLFANAVNTCNF